MESFDLGATGLLVTPIGLGLAALGRPGYLTLGHGDDLEGRRSVDELETHAGAVLDAAFAAGIRYFDAARSYGRAEEFLGRWLVARGVPVGVVGVGSKWGYTYTAGWRVDAEVHEVRDHSVATFEQHIGESKALLGGHLGLYQIHSATESSGVLEQADTLDRLRELRSGGLAVGLTTSGPDQAVTVRRALALEVDGRPLFQTVQATWNLLETSVGVALAEAHDAGLGIIVKEALANGRLTRCNPDLPAVLGTLDHTPDAVALAAVLARPWVDVVLSGAVLSAQLESNLGALDVTSDVIGELPEVAEAPEEYWSKRGALRWT